MPTRRRADETSDAGQYRALWADELAAAAPYRGLAELAEPPRREVFTRLAEVEERHAAHWASLLADAGGVPARPRTPLRVRLLVATARRFGVDAVLPTVVRMEAADRDRHDEIVAAPDDMAAEEAGHARTVAMPLTGGAGSMAAGEWISVSSQRELYEREIDVERAELAGFPDEEREELELIFRAKGMAGEQAAAAAAEVMADPEVALDTLVREELGLDPGDLDSPWVAAGSSFAAFAVGASVPVLPFVLAGGTQAVVASAVLSAVALFGVGVALSLFTGRSSLRSGLRMLAIGVLASAVTYGIGTLVGVGLA